MFCVLQGSCCICWTLPSAWRSRCSQWLSAMCQPARAQRSLLCTSMQTPTPPSSLFRYGAQDSGRASVSSAILRRDVAWGFVFMPGNKRCKAISGVSVYWGVQARVSIYVKEWSSQGLHPLPDWAGCAHTMRGSVQDLFLGVDGLSPVQWHPYSTVGGDGEHTLVAHIKAYGK